MKLKIVVAAALAAQLGCSWAQDEIKGRAERITRERSIVEQAERPTADRPVAKRPVPARAATEPVTVSRPVPARDNEVILVSPRDIIEVVVPENGSSKLSAERQRAKVERAETEQQRAEAEEQRAEAEEQRAEAEHQRAEAEQQRAEATAEKVEAAQQAHVRYAEVRNDPSASKTEKWRAYLQYIDAKNAAEAADEQPPPDEP